MPFTGFFDYTIFRNVKKYLVTRLMGVNQKMVYTGEDVRPFSWPLDLVCILLGEQNTVWFT